MQTKVQFITSWFLQEIARQRKNVFLWAPVFVGLGIILNLKWDIDLPWSLWCGAVFCISIGFFKSFFEYRKNGSYLGLFFLLLTMSILLVFMGVGLMKYRTQSLLTPILEKDIWATFDANIEKLSLLDGGKAKRVLLCDIEFVERDKAKQKLGCVRLKTYHFKGDGWNVGDRVRISAKLMAPSAPVVPGGFDFREKAFYERISAIGYTTKDAVLMRQGVSKSNHIQSCRDYIRGAVYGRVDARYAAIIHALLTGERDGIVKQDTENLRSSGLSHLLAISGLHVGLIAGCVFFFVRFFWVLIPGVALRYPIKKWAAGCAIIVAGCYMVLAGASVPVVRAFIMTSLVLLAVILDRSTLNIRLVALAALVVMITTPEAVGGPSFVLSFAAVSAIIAFYQAVGRKWFVNANAYNPLWRPFYYMVGVIMTTIIATLATAPFSAMFFNQIALYSVLSNILAMPIMAFVVMPFGLLSLMIMPFGWDGHLWDVVSYGVRAITEIASAVASMEGAVLYIPSFGFIETFLICFGFIWLVICIGHIRLIFLPILIGVMFMSQFDRGKYIFISDDMKSIMIVDKSVDKVFLIGRINSYLKQQWFGKLGINPTVDIKKYNYGDKLEISGGYCDDLMCVVSGGRQKVVILNSSVSLYIACDNSNVVISRIPVHDAIQCPNTQVIDRFDVWRHGNALIHLKNDRDVKIMFSRK